MVIYGNMVIYILVGGDWNHGILNDFPETVRNGKMIPTDEVHHFSEGLVNHQPGWNVVC